MLEHIAQRRQHHASRTHEQHTAPLEEAAGHEHDDDIEHRNRNAERGEGVYDEDRDGKGDSGNGKQGRGRIVLNRRLMLHGA